MTKKLKTLKDHICSYQCTINKEDKNKTCKDCHNADKTVSIEDLRAEAIKWHRNYTQLLKHEEVALKRIIYHAKIELLTELFDLTEDDLK